MVLDSATIRNLLRKINIPPLPQVACALIELAGDPDVDVREVAAVIQVDPMLTARLLKVANSSYFAQQREVTTVERAAVVLGLNYVKAAAMAVHLTAPFARLRDTGIEMTHFWEHAVLRGCIARLLAKRGKLPVVEQAFVIGLIQDVAIPPLAQCHGEVYASAYNRFLGDHLKLTDWEQEKLGFTHADLAAGIFDQWNLPPMLTRPIALHHTLCEPGPDGEIESAEIFQLALLAYFVGTLPLSNDVCVDTLDPYVNGMKALDRHLGLDVEAVADAISFARNEFETVCGLFQDFVPTSSDIGAVLAHACQCMGQVDASFYQVAFT